MHLARHSFSATTPTQIYDARFDTDNKIFTVTTPAGYAIYSTWPLKLLCKRELMNGTLTTVLPLHTTSLLFLLGGGRNPLYPPNKVIIWDEAIRKEVAELEFRERVRGMACRRGWLIVVLRRRVVAFQIGAQPQRWKEWDTCDNPRGLLALASAPHSTLLAIPGLQVGHVHLIHLPPCPPPPPDLLKPQPRPKPPPSVVKHPKEMIIAHETALTTLSIPSSGHLLATTSSRGTLIRIWDVYTGNLVRELRRGVDRADIYGVAFKSDENEICVWSDKGTIHIFRLGVTQGAGNRQSALAPLSPFLRLHKYFDSEWSYAHFRLPTPPSHLPLSNPQSITAPKDETIEEERCTVAWIEVPVSDDHGESIPHQHQLIALTFSGGWYRLALPTNTDSQRTSHVRRSSNASSSSIAAPSLSTSPPPAPTNLRSSPSLPPQRLSSQVRHSSQSSVSMSSRDKGKGRESDRDKDDSKESGRRCSLVEFRKFGRWDGW